MLGSVSHGDVMVADRDQHLELFSRLEGMLANQQGVLKHSVCETDEGTFEVSITLSEEDADVLQEVIDRLCSAIASGHHRDFSVVTRYLEHDFPTLTTLHVEGECVVIRTESQLDSGATYRRRMRPCGNGHRIW